MSQVHTDERRHPRPWLGLTVALISGAFILAAGLFGPGRVVVSWFVPVCDAAAIICLLVTLVLAGLDAELRRDRRSLPIVATASAMAVLWTGHLVLFPGVVPAFNTEYLSRATSSLFLIINLVTPLLLTVALLQRSGPLSSRPRAALRAGVSGLVAGLAGVAAALVLGTFLFSVTAGGVFTIEVAIVGAFTLAPVAAGLLAFVSGRRGDERVAAGVVAALAYSGMNSISLLFLQARYTPLWYADHVLASLPFVALLAGQLSLYSYSVRAELAASEQAARSAARLRTGLAVAEAMATEADLGARVDRLLAGAVAAVRADRASLLKVEPEGMITVEAGLDLQAEPAPIGRRYRLDDFQTPEGPILTQAVNELKAIRGGPYTVNGLAPEFAAGLSELRHTLILPLILGGLVDAVLVLSRRRQEAFTPADVELLQEFASIAALQIRNARLLEAAEAASIAKSSFLNLAAHELRTPITVINGYLDMLGDGTLGELSHELRQPLEMVREKSQELGQQVERLLLASRLEAGLPLVKRDGAPSVMDLSVVAAAAVERALVRARLTDQEIELIAPGGQLHAQAEPAEVGLILDNLLNNAMTYSGGLGAIRVEVLNGSEAGVRVVDHGIGIPAEQHERIFEQFHRVDDPGFGFPAGTGLGLFISRRLAELQNGQLELERSAPGEGSSFLLRLRRPLEPRSQPGRPQAPASRSTTGPNSTTAAPIDM